MSILEKPPSPPRRTTNRQVRTLLRQTATLVAAGLTIDRALDLLARQDEGSPKTALTQRLADRIRRGSAFSEAMYFEQDRFDALDISIVRAAEISGQLSDAIARLAEHHERRHRLAEQIRSAMIYPVILIVMAITAIVILFTLVVPELAPMITASGREPSATTQVVLALSSFLTGHGWILLIAAGISMSALLLPIGRTSRDKLVLALPALGPLWTRIETERWERGLSILLANGVALPEAVAIAADGFTNHILRRAGEHIADAIGEGRGLAVLMAEAGCFPVVAIQLVRVGEESGALEQTLAKAAEYQADEVNQLLARLIGLIEPVLILVLGVAVAGVILALLTTVANLNDALILG